jgi:hypothetical protein
LQQNSSRQPARTGPDNDDFLFRLNHSFDDEMLAGSKLECVL